MNYIQTWHRHVYGRLVILDQPYRKLGPCNHRHEHKHPCHQHISKYTSLHINRGYTDSSLRGHRPPKAKIICNTRLTAQKNEVEQRMKHYSPIRSKLSMIAGNWMKVKGIIIPCLLQRQILEQLYSNHMGIEKMRLLVREPVYWVNLNADIEDTI